MLAWSLEVILFTDCGQESVAKDQSKQVIGSMVWVLGTAWQACSYESKIWELPVYTQPDRHAESWLAAAVQ